MTIRQYRLPHTVIGDGAAEEAGALLKERGARRALVVCDKGVHQLGLVDGVLSSLKEAGIGFEIFSDVTPELPLEDVEKAIEAVRAGGFDAVVGWDPRERGGPLIAAGGRGCSSDLDGLRRSFRSVIQGYRMMVDCRGRAIPWRNQRRYSAAAFGADRDGRAVFVHSRTPYRMRELNRMIADLDLGIRGLVYMEGGPEASLVVRDGARSVTEIGSWEDGFNENDDNRELWEIPSVIGFARRTGS